MVRKIWNIIGFLILIIGVFTACKNEVLLLEEDTGLSTEILSDEGQTDTDDERNGGNVQDVSDDTIYVHICGAVVEPGVYELPGGSRIYDGVNQAGGFDGEADTEAVNLVDVLADGEQIRIPFVGENVSGAENGLININEADLDTLCQIPGIGESRAQAIVDYRQEHGGFQSAEELMQVPGIKEGIYANIYPYIECK